MTKRAKLLMVLVGAALTFRIGFEAVKSAAGPERKDFVIADMNGKPWRLSEHRGKHPLLINFLGVDCNPCRMEFPHLVTMQKEFASRGLEVVCLSRDPADALKGDSTFSTAPVTYLPSADKIFDQYHVDAIPHTIFFDSSGQVRWDVEGYDEAAIEAIQRSLR